MGIRSRARMVAPSSRTQPLRFGPPCGLTPARRVTPNMAQFPQSVLIVDPKGQLAAITAAKLARTDRAMRADPFGLFVDTLPHLKSRGWNPLLQFDPERNFEEDAARIADAIVTNPKHLRNHKVTEE